MNYDILLPWNSNAVAFLSKSTKLKLRVQYDQYSALFDQADCRFFVR